MNSLRTSRAFERNPTKVIPYEPGPISKVVSGQLVKVKFFFECGGCGGRFESEADDGAFEAPAGWSLFDIAVDSLRWSNFSVTSVQGGFLLCSSCTTEVDESVTDDRNATESEVRDALDLPGGE